MAASFADQPSSGNPVGKPVDKQASEAKAATRSQKNGAKPSATADKTSALTPETIDKAQAFATQHHPELGDLLVRLEKYDAAAFADAIDDVHKAMLRIERLGEKSAERGRVELEDWKLTSRIRLLAARLAMSDALSSQDPASQDNASEGDSAKSIKEEIRVLLVERAELRKSSLTAERERLTERLAKVNKQLGELNERERQTIERELARIEANATQMSAKRANAALTKDRQKSRPKANIPAPNSPPKTSTTETPATPQK
ncbi:MAG: hypothetical protein C0478_00330 [Planctomyces sp.]|nr:hypothetical protein [Planctomyces sp.]